MTITFNCEICGKSLSTSDEKAGRKAKCPGCGELFTVPTLEDGAANSAVELDGTDNRTTSTETKPCPMCGEVVSASAEKCEFCGEPLDAVTEIGQPRIIEFSDVFATAWDRYKERMGMAVVGNLVAGIVTLLGMIPLFGVFIAIAVIADQAGGDPEPLQFLWLIPAFVVGVAVVIFITPGLTLLNLKIAREEEVDIGTVFSGGRFFVKTAVCGFLFMLMVGLGFIAFIIPGIILGLRYWPYIYVIVDEDPPGLECFHRSAEITKGNWGAMLLIGIAGTFLNIAAQAICGILQLFTQPLNSLLFATAYVKMSGKVR